jgi:hypothetical protein
MDQRDRFMLYLRSTSRFILISLALFGLSVSSSNAATLNVVGGELIGASGVDVGGVLYDVSFGGGTCIALFNGCDDSSDFTFQTAAAADLASQAILDQIYGADDVYDTDPALTRGISPGFDAFVLTVWSQDPGALDYYLYDAAYNFRLGVVDQNLICTGFHYCGLRRADDNTLSPNTTFAVWSPSVSAVPVPAAVWLFGTALIGLVGFSKRRKAA